MFENVDAYVLLSEVNRFYMTKLETSAGCVIWAKDKKYFLTDFRYIEAAKNALPDWEVIMVTGSMYQEIGRLLSELNVNVIGYEDEWISVSAYKDFVAKVGNYQYVGVSNEFAAMRAIKTEEEISKIAAAQIVAQRALSKVITKLKPGITEREMAAEILYEMQMLGADNMSFDTIVAFGENSAMPHYRTGNRKLEKNDIILVDMGAKMNGYCSDMTRTFTLGEVNPKLADIHAIVLESQLNALAGIKAGMTGREADALAREYINANGYGPNFGHSLGHGVGIEVHEYPHLSIRSDEILQPNMIVTVEPGIYVEGLGGVRIEDMIVVKENGNLNLTNMDKNLNINFKNLKV